MMFYLLPVEHLKMVTAIFGDLTFHHTSFSCPDFLLEKSLWKPKKKKKTVLSADLSEFPFYVIRVNNVCES